jgi:hypothetical protein
MIIVSAAVFSQSVYKKKPGFNFSIGQPTLVVNVGLANAFEFTFSVFH